MSVPWMGYYKRSYWTNPILNVDENAEWRIATGDERKLKLKFEKTKEKVETKVKTEEESAITA